MLDDIFQKNLSLLDREKVLVLIAFRFLYILDDIISKRDFIRPKAFTII